MKKNQLVDQRRVALKSLAATLLLIGFLALSAAVLADSNIIVTSSADNTTAGDGLCTLREAITNANADSESTGGDCAAGTGADEITFAADYTITLAGSQLPAVTSAISISGNGQANTIIQAHASPGTATDRIFEVTTTGNLTLDGLTVQNGRCNISCSGAASNSGAGIYNAGILTVTDCAVSGNTASGGAIQGLGGGIANVNGSAALTNVTFSSNLASRGGGMHNENSNPSLTDVTFNDNSAGSGGGMYNENSSPTLTGVSFNANMADSNGGGMYNDSSHPTLASVTFSGNRADDGGGGMYNLNSSPTLTDVTFNGNSTNDESGGGMYSKDGSPTLTNVTFNDNSAESGGGMRLLGDSAVLTNVTFSGNSASPYGGGGLYNSGGTPTLTNVTFSGNSASPFGGPFGGGGLYNSNGGIPTLVNVIIAGSVSGGDCVNDASSSLNFNSKNNLIQGTTCGLVDGVNGNITGADPLLAALADNGGATQTHALLPGSPAIDKGDNTACPAGDQRGVVRPQGDHCDIGAFELGNLVCGLTENAPLDISNLELTITNLGSDLDCVRVTKFPRDHPRALAGMETGQYWEIDGLQSDEASPATGDFVFNIKLPHNLADHAQAVVCKFPANGSSSSWTCGRGGSDATTVWQDNISGGFSDWTVSEVDPTAVTLREIAARTANSGWWLLLVVMCGLTAVTIGLWRQPSR